MGENIMILSIVVSLLTVTVLLWFLRKTPESERQEKLAAEEKKSAEVEAETEAAKVIEEKKPSVVEVKEPTISFADRLKKGLSRSRNEIWGKVAGLFRSGINADTLEQVEELLYSADLGPQMTQELIDALEAEVKKGEISEEKFKEFLFQFLNSKMQTVQETVRPELLKFNKATHQGTKVIMIVGVNGAGKTTTIGKLATKLRQDGASVVVGACDTFRAAAVDQLQVWCDRAGATMIRAKEGANPTGVAYDALQHALNEKADYCILDTAGRLHTKENLMDELKKTKSVLTKLDPVAPHETLLVIDAITGQNALRQADEFHKTLTLSGLIFTKCDGSSKAGSAVGIVKALQVPIVYIGVGESAEDLDHFVLEDYLKALLDF